MRHGFCCGVIPLIFTLACGLGAWSYCHHGCRHHDSDCHTNQSCSSCHGNSCSNLICRKCRGTYSLDNSYKNKMLCSACLQSLREDLLSRNNHPERKIRRACEECRAKYETSETNDCGLCPECLANYCSAQD